MFALFYEHSFVFRKPLHMYHWLVLVRKQSTLQAECFVEEERRTGRRRRKEHIEL